MKRHDYKDIDEYRLITWYQQGDDAAFKEIYLRYKPDLYVHAVKMLNDRDEALDVVQDVFLKLWNKRQELYFETSLSSYLHTAVRNKILDIFSRNKVSARYIESLQDFINQGDYTTDNQVREKEMQHIIDNQIAALPEKMREVFTLSRQGHLSHQTIAQNLNISETTVKKHIAKAIKRMRPNLEGFIILIYLLTALHFYLTKNR